VRLIAPLVAAVALAIALFLASPASALYGTQLRPPSPGKIYWGIYREGAPWDATRVTGLQTIVGRKPSVMMAYQTWYGRPAFPGGVVQMLANKGIVTMVSWEPWKPMSDGSRVIDQPDFRLRRIANGAYDRYIRRYARGVKAFGGPVMLRPFHEMDGNWYPWGGTVNGNRPSDMVAAWRHIWRIFHNVGANNVTWVWSVNHRSVPNTTYNNVHKYWPGRSYVNWIGISGFNWGSAAPYGGWLNVRQIYGRRVRALRDYRRPIIFTEMASVEVGGNKATWITNSFAYILSQMPRVRGVMWYDERESATKDWRIDSSATALGAFIRAISGSRVLSASAAWQRSLR
jgi:hypothetical protein